MSVPLGTMEPYHCHNETAVGKMKKMKDFLPRQNRVGQGICVTYRLPNIFLGVAWERGVACRSLCRPFDGRDFLLREAIKFLHSEERHLPELVIGQ